MTVMVGLPVCACIPYCSAAPPLSQPYIYGVFLLADGAMRLQRLAAFDSRITVENGGLMYRYFGLSAFGREQRQQPVVSQLQYSWITSIGSRDTVGLLTPAILSHAVYASFRLLSSFFLVSHTQTHAHTRLSRLSVKCRRFLFVYTRSHDLSPSIYVLYFRHFWRGSVLTAICLSVCLSVSTIAGSVARICCEGGTKLHETFCRT